MRLAGGPLAPVAGTQAVLEPVDVLGGPGLVHELLIELHARIESFFGLVAFLAVLKLVLIRGVHREGQLLGGVRQKGLGGFHHDGGLAHKRALEGVGGCRGRRSGRHLPHLVMDGKIDGHASSSPAARRATPFSGPCRGHTTVGRRRADTPETMLKLCQYVLNFYHIMRLLTRGDISIALGKRL